MEVEEIMINEVEDEEGDRNWYKKVCLNCRKKSEEVYNLLKKYEK